MQMVFGVADIAYKDGFEKKHKAGVIIAPELVLANEELARPVFNQAIDSLGLQRRDVIHVHVHALVKFDDEEPEPSDLGGIPVTEGLSFSVR